MSDTQQDFNDAATLSINNLRRACLQLIKLYAENQTKSDAEMQRLLGDHTQYYYKVRAGGAVKLESLLTVALRLGFSIECNFFNTAGEKL